MSLSFYSSDPFVFDIDKDFNLLFPKNLSSTDKLVFKLSPDLRNKVKKAFIQLLNTIGFDLDDDLGILQISTITLPFTERYYQMLKFLKKIKLNNLACIFLLIVCVYKIIPIPQKWIDTQDFLQNLTKTITEQKEIKFQGLSFTGNSCYMDCTLLNLLLFPNSVIKEHILESDISKYTKSFNPAIDLKESKKRIKPIQTELNKINFFLTDGHEPKNCKELRKTFSKCKGTQEFHNTNTQDAGEFLQYLFNLFNMNDLCKDIVYTYAGNSITKLKLVDTHSETSSPIIQIVESLLSNLRQDLIYPITSFIKQIDIIHFDSKNLCKYKDVSYSEKMTITKKSIQIPLAIFYVKRLGYKKGTEHFYKTMIYPTPTLFRKNYSHLNLSGIVIHTGGAHYVTVLKRNGIWYFYDDNPGGNPIIKKIGSFEEMLQTKPSPITNGTLYFYD